MDNEVVFRISTIFLCCLLVYLTESSRTQTDQASLNTVNDKDKISSHRLSQESFADALNLIKKSQLYNRIQEVLVHYVQHFLIYGKMTMLTKNGEITVPLNDQIERNLSIMVQHILHIECTYAAFKNEKSDFTDPLKKYRFIRNNTVVLDKIIEHANASFRAHEELEKRQEIRFYKSLKNDTKFFKTDHLKQTMTELVETERAAASSLSDLVKGKLYGSNTEELNAEECLDIGNHASVENINQTIQFYEAAIRRLDMHDYVLLNKSQILQKVINFYTPYGKVCQGRVRKLKDKLEKSLTEDDGNDDDEKTDGKEENETYGNGEWVAVENTEKTDVNRANKTNKKDENGENDEKVTNETKNTVENKENVSNKNGHKVNKRAHMEEGIRDESKKIKGKLGVNSNETVENLEDITAESPHTDDEECVKEIINKFSRQFVSKHDEL